MKYLLFVLLSASLVSCSSFIPVEIENGKALGIMPMQYGHIYYQGTHKVQGSREDIFRQVRRWAAFRSTRTIHTSAYSALKVPNPTQALYIGDNLLGDVITTGTIDPILRGPGTTLYWPATHYAVSVECYDGSYRTTLTNFYTFGLTTPHYLDVRDKGVSLKQTREFYRQIDAQVMALISELETFVRHEAVRE
jgi:hypothetical protein